jgi:small subunit ribosomal protein S1
MTEQERPDQERNELLGDLLSAANTAVAEPDTQPSQPEAESEQATPSAEQAKPVEPAAVSESAAEPAAVSEPAAEPAAVSEPAEPAAEPVAVSEPAAEPVAVSEPVEQATEPAAVSESAEPAAEAAEPAEAVESAAEAAEASYTPTAEADEGRPRRVKDLSAGMELEGRVTSIALYGVFVDIGVGRDGLVHISEMSDTRIDSPSDVVKIGDSVKVRVKSVEPDGKRISLTMRTRERSSEPRQRGRKKPEINRDALAALRVGDNVEGTITGISNFGVFVDINVGKDGLVHVSELAEGRIEKAEDVVSVGQTYTFKVLEVDAEGARISLSLRRAQRSQRLQQLEKGQIIEGTVSGIAPFGAFVDIGVGRDGLVHISELTEGRVAKVEDAVTVGQKVQVRVLDVDPGNKRISLSMLLEDRPREEQTEYQGVDRNDRPERGPRSAARFEQRPDRGPRAPRQDRGPQAPRDAEVYRTPDEPEEQFTGDATIEDLLSKYGGATNRRDRRRRDDVEEEESAEDQTLRRQREAIRRTIQHMGDDE